MKEIPFIKIQNVGNHFVLLKADDVHGLELERLAVGVCGHRFGVGADGLLLVGKEPNGKIYKRMWNPDGTEDFCGNGLLCVGYYANQTGLISESDFTIQTKEGEISAKISDNGNRISIILPEPQFEPEKIPITLPEKLSVKNYTLNVGNQAYIASSVSTGTTHTVIFVDDLPNDEEFFTFSPLIENHEYFPERTTVLWTKILDDKNLQVRIWERGAGETYGCGTGACAVAVYAKIKFGIDHQVNVMSKGGTLSVEWLEGNGISLTGEPRVVYQGIYLFNEINCKV